jgi:SAM-dependent methyltransferase
MYGYHSYTLDDVNITAQRNPKMRLDEFRKFIDFADKNVLDFGCNVGAMLHHLPEIKEGIGIDFDPKCINAATNIAEILEYTNQKFYVHDCDKDSYEELKDKITFKPDVIFLLSLGSWIQTWRDLYSFCLEYPEVSIVLEINNEDEGKPQLEFFRENGYEPELIVNHSLDDSTNNNRRRTYLIKK